MAGNKVAMLLRAGMVMHDAISASVRIFAPGNKESRAPLLVIPAQAGIQCRQRSVIATRLNNGRRPCENRPLSRLDSGLRRNDDQED